MKDHIDHLLREQQPLPDSSPDLHDSIMRAVEASRSRTPTQNKRAHGLSFSWPRLAYGLTLVMAAAVSAFVLVHQMERRTGMTVSAKLAPEFAERLQSAWDFLDEVSTNTPTVLARPMLRQIDQLSSDFRNKTDTLLASLPTPQQ